MARMPVSSTNFSEKYHVPSTLLNDYVQLKIQNLNQTTLPIIFTALVLIGGNTLFDISSTISFFIILAIALTPMIILYLKQNSRRNNFLKNIPLNLSDNLKKFELDQSKPILVIGGIVNTVLLFGYIGYLLLNSDTGLNFSTFTDINILIDLIYSDLSNLIYLIGFLTFLPLIINQYTKKVMTNILARI